MDPEYGKKVGLAFAAVYQLHRDTSRLLLDAVPRLWPNRRTDNQAFDGISGSVNNPDHWMPYAVSMTAPVGEPTVTASEFAMIFFWDEPPKPQEPHLVLARVGYKKLSESWAKPDFWDAWNACFKWGQPFPAGVVNHFSPPDHERVENVIVTAVPLFSITSVDDVLAHMQKVRERATHG